MAENRQLTLFRWTHGSERTLRKYLVKNSIAYGVQAREKIVAGQALLLPDIPPLQWKTPVANNPNYGIPRIQAARIQVDKVLGRTTTTVSDIGRKAEALVSQWRWLSVQQAIAEAQQSDASTSKLEFWTQPITIKFAEGQPQAPAITAAPVGAVHSDVAFIKALINATRSSSGRSRVCLG